MTTTTVRALRSFYQGPRDAAGHRFLAVERGSLRKVAGELQQGSPFWTTDRLGRQFGLCRVGDGWAIVRVDSDRPRRALPQAEEEDEAEATEEEYWPI